MFDADEIAQDVLQSMEKLWPSYSTCGSFTLRFTSLSLHVCIASVVRTHVLDSGGVGWDQKGPEACLLSTHCGLCYCAANECFWSHEWSCHGSCSGWNQHDYFSNTINLHNNNDIAVSAKILHLPHVRRECC